MFIYLFIYFIYLFIYLLIKCETEIFSATGLEPTTT